MPHHDGPDKDPRLRVATIEAAGGASPVHHRGLGRDRASADEVIGSLFALARLQQYGGASRR